MDPGADSATAKDDLRSYLRLARESLLWKLDGVSERDQRRPLTPTGTNLLGLVKHAAFVELGYLGDCFGRPSPVPFPWGDDPDAVNANLDMYARADESPSDIMALARLAAAQADETIADTDLATRGTVAWWPSERNRPTLHRVLVHVIADLSRHAGHADILRESLDGKAGLRADNDNLPAHDAQWWTAYLAQLNGIADAVS